MNSGEHWTCGHCGASVVWGCTHYCSGTHRTNPDANYSEFRQLMAKLDQIISLLQEMRQ